MTKDFKDFKVEHFYSQYIENQETILYQRDDTKIQKIRKVIDITGGL